MGTRTKQPKSLKPRVEFHRFKGREVPKYRVELSEELALDMQVAVKDALLEGTTSDNVLGILISLTTKELTSGRPLFENPLDEPILYSRYFRPWVKEALEALKKIQERSKQKK